MIFYCIPYSTNGRLFQAYNEYASLVKDPNDYICFLDGDTMFLVKHWGHVIERYVKEYPDAGLYTCYASRCSYRAQIPKHGDNTNPNLNFHIGVAKLLNRKHSLKLGVKYLNRRIAGHLMMIKKSTWDEIKADVAKEVEDRDKRILGVDTIISRAILKRDKKILVMRAVYLLHLFRLDGRLYR